MKIQIRETADPIAFIKAVKNDCRSDIFLHTREGDCLNLRSALSQYIFAMIAKKHLPLDGCYLTCEDADAAALRKFTNGAA